MRCFSRSEGSLISWLKKASTQRQRLRHVVHYSASKLLSTTTSKNAEHNNTEVLRQRLRHVVHSVALTRTRTCPMLRLLVLAERADSGHSRRTTSTANEHT